jgi:uncharacterized protein (TIGR00645 family)
MKKFEQLIEKFIFGSRWLLAPLYLGLMLALVPIIYRFFHAFWHLIAHMTSFEPNQITLSVLELLDTVLLGNLILIVLFSGYENFVSKIKIAEGAEDRPQWMGQVDYSGLKIKLIGSLVAISVIELLKDFMQSGPYSTTREAWRVGIHMTFVVSGVLFAIMDNLADRGKSDHK